MTNHFLLVCSTITFYEIFKYINFLSFINKSLELYLKIFNLFKIKKVSDFRKEKLILYYSKSLLITSFKILALISSIVTFILVISLLSNSFLNLIISLLGIIEIIIVSLTYHILRKRIYAKL